MKTDDSYFMNWVKRPVRLIKIRDNIAGTEVVCWKEILVKLLSYTDESNWLKPYKVVVEKV